MLTLDVMAMACTDELLTQNGGALNNDSPSNTYVTAMIFSLAHPYGKPTILSSYVGFENSDLGSPNGGTPSTSSGSFFFPIICMSRCWYLFRHRWCQWLAMPAQMGGYLWHGRF